MDILTVFRKKDLERVAKAIHAIEVKQGITTTVWDNPKGSLREVRNRDIYLAQARVAIETAFEIAREQRKGG